MSEWRQPAMPCPVCGSMEDLRVMARLDGGLDYQCRACGDSGILDVQPQIAGVERIRTRAQAQAVSRAAAAGWRKLADECEAMAAWDAALGHNVSAYHAKAALYRQVAADLEAQYR